MLRSPAEAYRQEYADRTRKARAMHCAEYKSTEISQFPEPDRYKFLVGTVLLRPIALVAFIIADDVLNAVPFCQFAVTSVSPRLLGFVAQKRPDGYKDTVCNVLEPKEFVAEQVQECSDGFPPSVSEVEQVGFHTFPSTIVRPGRVAESPTHFECRLNRAAEFDATGSRTPTRVGEVLLVHFAEGVLSGHQVKHEVMNSAGRIAGRSYFRTRDRLDV